MAAEPSIISASLELPPDTSQPNAILSHAFSGTFLHGGPVKLELIGASTHSVGFGTIPAAGAKAVWLEYENLAPTNAVVLVTFNAGDPIPISPGGFLLYSNPTPAAGITAMTIAHTTTCTVRVALLG